MTKGSFITKKEIKKMLSKRDKNTCKNDYGHVFILAGSVGMTGAAVLASQAAMRIGAGLVTLGIPESLNSIVEMKLTEVMTLPLPQTKEGNVDKNAYNKILQFIEKRKVSSLIVGPGLSCGQQTVRLVKKIIQNIELPCILDADGINALEGQTQYSTSVFNRTQTWQIPELNKAKATIIMTPHPGELGRLINESSRNIQKDRIRYATRFAQKNDVIVVLKGYQTIITNGIRTFVNPTGNPGMATAGCGDVLTGMIGGLINQVEGKNLLKAAILGVYLHGLAGDLAARDKTEPGLIATDILERIPQAIKKVNK